MSTKRTDQTYATLRRRIMSGHYAPGEHLREEHIGQELGVSRTPVRGALQRLEADRLVIMEPRGAIVARWTAWDVAEVSGLRILLEPYAASLAAKNAEPHHIAEMDALNAEMMELAKAKSEHKLARIEAVNNAFHHLILEAAGSGRLKGLAGPFVDTPMMLGSFYFYDQAEIIESVQHHTVITDAIRRGDADFARRAMEYHLRIAIVRFEKQRVAGKTDAAADLP